MESSYRQAYAVLLISAMILILAGPAFPQSDSGCISMAAVRLVPNEEIVIKTDEGREIKGNLLSVSPSQSVLTMYLADADNFTSSILREDEISRIRYHRKGKVRPAFLAVGTIVGFVAGIYIEELLTSSGHVKFEPFQEGEFWHGDYIGALSGFTAGLVLSMLIPHSVDIACGAAHDQDM